MPTHPLEFGWHTDPESNTSDTPTFTPAMSTLLGGALQRSPAEILYGPNQPRESGSTPDVTPAAWGDRTCSECGTLARRSGNTGMYIIGRRFFCRSCAVKELGVESEPSDEQVQTLTPFLDLSK